MGRCGAVVRTLDWGLNPLANVSKLKHFSLANKKVMAGTYCLENKLSVDEHIACNSYKNGTDKIKININIYYQ